MENQRSRTSSLIQSVDVDGLFGHFRYRLRSTASCRGDYRLFLLYGDNGAGKSTILKIVFHLLHPAPYENHRSAVGPIPFRLVKIALTSGYVITTEKDDPFDKSQYRLRLIQPDSNEVVDYLWEHDRRERQHENPSYSRYCETLKEIGLAFHFLSDTRRVAGVSERSNLDPRAQYFRPPEVHHRRVFWRESNETTEEPEVQVGEAVERTIGNLRQLALAGTSVGYTSVNTIYEELIGRIVEPGSDGEESRPLGLDELRNHLEALRETNFDYAKYGLTPDLETGRLLELLTRARESNVQILNTVLKPYFDGHDARLHALKPAQKVIDEFVTMLAEFFSRKTVELNVQTGLQILDQNSRRIPPESLSSGERQLLVLFCNAITARKDGTVLIID